MSKHSALSKQVKPPKDKNKLFTDYSYMVRYIAQRIASRLPSNYELDDLISSGVIGLMDAIEKFEPNMDRGFKTYAEFRIRGAILDELRAQDWVPRSVRDKSKLLDKTIAELCDKLGRNPRIDELAQALSMSLDELHQFIHQARPVRLVSIEEIAKADTTDKKTLLNQLEDTNTQNPFTQLNTIALKKMMATAIENLPEREKLALSLYYYEDLNLKEIGQVLKISEGRVSQLQTQAMARLKIRLKGILKSTGEFETI